MPIIPPGSEAALTYTAQDIIVDALIEIGALAPGEMPSPDEGQWAFRKLNYLIDTWSAEVGYVYTKDFSVFTLVPNLSPHTIGPAPGATYPMVARPVRVEACALILNSNEQVDLPMNIRDDDWWAANQVKQITSNVPTDLYYSPDWPNGQLFFWPVPNQANQIRMELWLPLNQYDQINDPLYGANATGNGSLPQGYRNALMLTLAETLGPGSNRPISPDLAKSAWQARKAILGNNNEAPRIATKDWGMPRSGYKKRGDFNWYSGQPW